MGIPLNGTFLRLLAVDAENKPGAFEVKIPAVAVPAPVDAAASALAAATFGSTAAARKPSTMAYGGYELVLRVTTPTVVGGIGNGDAQLKWTTIGFDALGHPPSRIAIPGRDPNATGMYSSAGLAAFADPVWVAWLALVNPATAISPFINQFNNNLSLNGAYANVRGRVRPRVTVIR